MSELKNETIAAVAQVLVSEKIPLGLEKMPSEDEEYEITFGYPVSDDDEESVAEVPTTETPTNGGSQLTEDDYEAMDAWFDEQDKAKKAPSPSLEERIAQATQELHAAQHRVLVLKQQEEQKSATETESPVDENEKSVDASVDTSVDVASSQEQLAEVKQFSIVKMKPSGPPKAQKQKTSKPPKDLLKNSRIFWEKFTVEFGGQKKTFWKIKRGFWKNLASL